MGRQIERQKVIKRENEPDREGEGERERERDHVTRSGRGG
jgi:hypothetical protein